jgi:hypothetical protein
MTFERTKTDALNAAEALELRTQGLTYREIGNRLGVDASTAFRRCQNALAEIPAQAVEEHRHVELARLDALLSACWQEAMQGKASAIRSALGIIDRRAKILGLDAPTRSQTLDWALVDRELARLDALLGDGTPASRTLAKMDACFFLSPRPPKPLGAVPITYAGR